MELAVNQSLVSSNINSVNGNNKQDNKPFSHLDAHLDEKQGSDGWELETAMYEQDDNLFPHLNAHLDKKREGD